MLAPFLVAWVALAAVFVALLLYMVVCLVFGI